MSKRVYLDNAATTPVAKQVAKAMADFQSEFFGNPSSLHREGQEARAKIDFAREAIAKSIFAKPQELIFTSGATEANNLALLGVVSSAIFNLKIKYRTNIFLQNIFKNLTMSLTTSDGL